MNIKWLLVVLVGLTVMGCSSEQRKSLNIENKPNALGNPFQVLVVGEQTMMNGEVGDTLFDNLTAPYLVVPIPEPVLDLDYKDPRDFTNYVKHRRSIIIVGTLDGESVSSRLIQNALGTENVIRARENKSFRFAMDKDKYARGQLIFYLFAPTASELPSAISKASPKIIKEIYKNDNVISKASAFAGGLNKAVMNDVEDKLNLKIDVPVKYSTVNEGKMDDSTFWIRYETKDLGYHLLIRDMGVGSDKDLTEKNIIEIRNSIGKRYVKTNKKNTYMTTEVMNKPYPVFKLMKLGNNLAMEGRGLWKTEGDFMGGSFINYLVYSPNSNRLIFAEGLLYAPQKSAHRNYVERLKSILLTLKF